MPDLRQVPEVWEGASGSTAGAQRVAERVRAALAAQPALAGSRLGVDGYEGGVIILSGQLVNSADRALAVVLNLGPEAASGPVLQRPCCSSARAAPVSAARVSVMSSVGMACR